MHWDSEAPVHYRKVTLPEPESSIMMGSSSCLPEVVALGAIQVR